MSAWTHRFDKLNDVVVACAPTATLIVDVLKSSHGSISGIITNTSLTQTLGVEWSTSWDGSSRWAPLAAVNASQFSEPIGPGESRHFQFEIGDLRFIRAHGVASGVGLTAYVAVQLVSNLPVR